MPSVLWRCDHPLRGVNGRYLSAQIRHLAGKLAVPAGSIENDLSAGQVQKLKLRSLDQEFMEVVSFSHASVPKVGISIPNFPDFLIQPSTGR